MDGQLCSQVCDASLRRTDHVVSGFVLITTLIFAMRGYSKGLVRELIGIAALVLAFMFAEQAGGLVPAAVIDRMGIPLVLRPGVQKGLGAMIVLVGAIVIGQFGATVLASGQSQEAEARHRKQDQMRGAFFGGVKGFLIAMLLLVVVYNLGQVAEVVDRGGGPAGKGDAAIEDQGSKTRRLLAGAKRRIDQSALGGIVEMSTPFDSKAISLVGDVIDVANDPEALRRLQQQPEVRGLMANPKIAGLARDPDIMEAAKERRFLDILNSEKLSAVVHDPELRAELKKIDVESIIKSAKGAER